MSTPKTKPQAPGKDGVSAAIEAVAMVRDALASLQQRQRQLTGEGEKLRARNCTLLALPVRFEEARQYVFDYIDAKGAGFEQHVGWSDVLQNFAKPKGYRPPVHDQRREMAQDQPMRHGGPLNMADVMMCRGNKSNSIGSLVGVNGFLGESLGSAGGDVLQRALYYFFGDAIKQRVGEYFDKHFTKPPQAPGNTADGLTIQQRQVEIEGNEARLAEIDAELQTLAEQVAALSIGEPAEQNHFGYTLAELRSAK